jgi:two-component system nitrate/nitrite response regulator NarL
MAGVVICHGSTVIRERLVVTAAGVPSFSPVRGAGSVDELTTLARRNPPIIVLLDAHLPGPGPVEAIRRLRAITASASVVMLAVPGDEVALDRAVALGARGYLAPDVGRAELAAVAAHVLASPLAGVPERGTTRVDPGPLVGRVLVEVLAQQAAREELALTKREVEVLVGMSNGRSNSQIGADLFLSEDTVKTHARRLFRKLSASDRAQAVAIGLRRGLIR